MTTALANPNQVAWKYTSDGGDIFGRVRAKYAIVSQLDNATPMVGGEAAAIDVPRLNPSLKMRYVIVQGNTTDTIRRVTAYTPDAPIWADLAKDITLLIAGVDEVCSVIGYVGERYLAGATGAGHQ